MDKKLSFLFLAGTLGHGGAEKQLYLLVKTLYNKSHKVSVVSFGNDEYWENIIRNIGIPIVSIKSSKRFIRFIKLMYLCFILKPDIFYSYHFYTSGYVGLICKFFPNIKSIGSVRNDGYSEVKSNGFWSKYHMKLPDLIIANSKQGLIAIHSLLGLPLNKLHFISNAIEIHKFDSKTKENPLHVLKIVFIGRLVKEKNPEMFISICNELKYSGIKFSAEIYGDGFLKQKMIDLIQNFDLDERVKICGINTNISNELNNYDILISTSLNEGTPNVLLESINNEICFFAFKNESTIEFVKIFNLSEFLFEDINQAINLCSNYYKNKFIYNSLIKNAKSGLIMNYSTETQYLNFIKLVN